MKSGVLISCPSAGHRLVDEHKIYAGAQSRELGVTVLDEADLLRLLEAPDTALAEDQG